uniref:Uncharacterized protein n=1 Tax=Prymnesium polylepis TaxID=72548 RepID=A0A7S4MAR9_9EUKA
MLSHNHMQKAMQGRSSFIKSAIRHTSVMQDGKLAHHDERGEDDPFLEAAETDPSERSRRHRADAWLKQTPQLRKKSPQNCSEMCAGKRHCTLGCHSWRDIWRSCTLHGGTRSSRIGVDSC